MANYALGGEPVIDFATAFTTLPLFDGTGWNAAECADCGASADRMPRVETRARPSAGAQQRGRAGGGRHRRHRANRWWPAPTSDGDVLVLCGTTLIVWATIPASPRSARLWTIPHTAAGKCQIGGASNAGGLFLNWVDRLVAR